MNIKYEKHDLSCLTQNIKNIAVTDGAILVLYHTGIVSSVWGHNTFHHQAPVLVS